MASRYRGCTRGQIFRAMSKTLGRCFYCGSMAQNVDHYVPRNRPNLPQVWAAVPRNSDDNRMAACLSCNRSKGNLTPDEFRAMRGGHFWADFRGSTFVLLTPIRASYTMGAVEEMNIMEWTKETIREWLKGVSESTSACDNPKTQGSIGRALLLIYARQTATEQASLVTNQSNGRGFNGTDAAFGSSVAQKFSMYNRLSPKQCKTVARMLVKYSGQLAEARAALVAPVVPVVPVAAVAPVPLMSASMAAGANMASVRNFPV